MRADAVIPRSTDLPEWLMWETNVVLFRQPGEVRERRFRAQNNTSVWVNQELAKKGLEYVNIRITSRADSGDSCDTILNQTHRPGYSDIIRLIDSLGDWCVQTA